MNPRTRYALWYVPSKLFYRGLEAFMKGVIWVFKKPKE